MSAEFAKLCEAIPPPTNPVETGSPQEFVAVEARLSISLPDDYKNLIGVYGTGSWKGFLWVLNPFSANRHLNLIEQVQRQLDAERATRADYPNQVPFALYPEAGGLLPWAMTDNGDRLYWLTEGRADDWATIVFESRGPQYDSHAMSCCKFLRRWVAGQLQVSVFPDDFEYGFIGAFEPLPIKTEK